MTVVRFLDSNLSPAAQEAVLAEVERAASAALQQLQPVVGGHIDAHCLIGGTVSPSTLVGGEASSANFAGGTVTTATFAMRN